MRGIRSNSVKMVIIAPNIDPSGAPGALDEKVEEILSAARNKAVPIVCALSKRRLGKALGKGIKVSIVGIYSFEGAHELRKQIEKITRVP
jgi:selenocysteine insertion sequence-binding protein 2